MIIGVDIGGTKVSAARVQDGVIIERRQAPSPVHTDLRQLVPIVLSLLEGWVQEARGIGVACTGLVSEGDVTFLSTGQRKRLPLKSLLRQATGLPVWILNDAWAAAWGEFSSGTHPGETLVYVTVSTGIGGGIVQNGRLLTAAHGFAAHVGHMSVPRHGHEPIPCHCGRFDCVEAIASGTAIEARAAALLGQSNSCRNVFEQVPRQPVLSELVDEAAGALAETFANLRALSGTAHVVLGGGVGLNPVFRARLVKAVGDLPGLYRVEVRTPSLGPDSGLVGAALAMPELSENS